MTREPAPHAIRALADARAAARRARDWPVADDLKRQIAEAGWKMVDVGTMYDLVPAAPPDVVVGGVTRYGSSSNVPSRLDETPVGLASVVVVVDDDHWAAARRLLAALAANAPEGTQVVLVANGVDDRTAVDLEALDALDPGAPGIATEVVETAAGLGWAVALNAGIRRAMAPVVVIAEADLELAGDVVTGLAAALGDPGVAVAGPDGLVTADFSRFLPAPAGASDVVAVDGTLLAFRRDDYARCGPLDEHFVHPAGLGAWWSLVLRDEPAGEAGPEAAEPRRAVQVADLPVSRPARPDGDESADPGEARQVKRNRYRVLKRFATRRDLLA